MSIHSSHRQVHSMLLAIPNRSESVCKPNRFENSHLRRRCELSPFTILTANSQVGVDISRIINTFCPQSQACLLGIFREGKLCLKVCSGTRVSGETQGRGMDLPHCPAGWGVRIWRLTASLPRGEKNDPRGSERLEEHRHTLTQEGPEVVTCVQGGVEHPHVRGALTQRPQR